ncbi:MAG TPA: hypothetical protein VMJ34_20125 [Bryobacteraceae bacterium]|nr:hypothetical protein [Bryobacteraceae bacterium]
MFLSLSALLLSPAALAQLRATSGGSLAITTTSCPGGVQGAAYTGCAIQVSGGAQPYTFSVDNSGNYPPLPEGMSLNTATGAITSSKIGGQGTYMPLIIVKDNASAQATRQITFAINGSNAFLANIFPPTSIFHHRVDAATTGLPVDTSPAAPMYSGYLSATVKPFFGNTSGGPFPNGIPAFEVPYNQPDVAVTTTVYQSYFTSGPIPANAPVEGTSVTDGDRHVLIYRAAGGGNLPALYEMWQGIYLGGPWTDSSNALWPDVSSNALTTQGNGTSDAAGLPVAPLLVNADEVIGTGTPSAPNGVVQHPTRFTLNHMLNYWVWPGTETAGVGSCKDSKGKSISTGNLISQATPPSSCTMSGPAGEIYRLKASVPNPACAATSPQAAIIITGFRNYGIILADNGMSGGLIGTPDARWNDDDLQCLTSLTLNDFEPVNVSSLMVDSGSGATLSSSVTLTLSTVGNGTLTANPPSADGTYSPGTKVCLTATPATGWAFGSWSGAALDGSNCLVMNANAAVTANFACATACVSLDQPSLYFGATNGGAVVTAPQKVQVTASAGVSWSVGSNQPYIIVSPTSGKGSGSFTVSIQSTTLPSPSTQQGNVTVTAPSASNSPQAVQVSVKVMNSSATGSPFGSFDTPANNTTGIAGSVAVTGWALDNIGVQTVQIWRNPIGSEATASNGLIYIGDATFVPGARPDVQSAYPNYPQNNRAGWGYLMLTNGLPNNGGATGTGNGTYVLHAIATSIDGKTFELGTRTITCDNADATIPFGAIDTPGQGETVSGTIVNFGWALTPQPYSIPTDGSTITVTVDGVTLGHPVYNQYRSDIATGFPGYANANGAVGYFTIDTTTLTNGIHTIGWLVYDNNGKGAGIGSRFFWVQN